MVALVLLEWCAGWLGAAAWTQSWAVVRRGHFRILAWGSLILALLSVVAFRSAARGVDAGAASGLVTALAVGALLYVALQYVRSDRAGAVMGAAAAAVGVAALLVSAGLMDGWPVALAAANLVAGALLMGGVSNGMMLGHWYLNQPGLKPWALARLTTLSVGAVGAAGATGLIAAGRLAGADTPGAVLGLPGFGESFGAVFFAVWVGMLGFTGVVVWMARRCVKLRSIQSATGLYYVALLTAGTSEFLVRYLMVSAA